MCACLHVAVQAAVPTSPRMIDHAAYQLDLDTLLVALETSEQLSS